MAGADSPPSDPSKVMNFSSFLSSGLERFWQRGRRFTRKLAHITATTRPAELSLESLQWAVVHSSGLSQPELPDVRWRDLTACVDASTPPELFMAAGTRITYRLNLPIGSAFHTRCRWLSPVESSPATSVRFTATVRKLVGEESELRQVMVIGRACAAGGDLFRLDLQPLEGQRVELTLGLENSGGVESVPEQVGTWIDPRLMYTKPRPAFAKRFRSYFAVGGLRRLKGNLAEIVHEPGGKGKHVADFERIVSPAAPILIFLKLEGHQPDLLRRAIRSVLAQSSNDWELLLLVSDTTRLLPDVQQWLDNCAAADKRIRFLPAGAAFDAVLLATKRALVATLRETDLLARGAVEQVRARFAESPSAPWLYTDEEFIDADSRRAETRHKPLWGLDSLLSGMLPGRWSIYQREAIVATGGFCADTTDAGQYELALRFVEAGQYPLHLPLALYRTHMPTSEAACIQQAERRAADAFLTRTRPDAQTVASLGDRYFRTRYRIEGTPLISIILPTNGVRRTVNGQQIDLLATCVRSIISKSDYPHFEVVCVDNANLQPETLASLDALHDPRVRVISYTAPFNLPDKFNWAVEHAKGEHLLLLNDDTEVITAEWLSAMLEFSQQPRVGAVGAKLFYPNGQLQHAGVPFRSGMPIHRAYGLPGDLEKAMPEVGCIRNFPAVTGACVMTRRALYEQVGGFRRSFPLNYNDADYCLKVRATGHDVVFTPFAQLWHYESFSREKGAATDEIELMRSLWSTRVEDDPDERSVVWVSGATFNWVLD